MIVGRRDQGSESAYMSKEGTVVLEKDASNGEGDPFVCFEEWKSEEDESLYREL
jgi:hypothetical protein